jgi:site-specific DNA recombinase
MKRTRDTQADRAAFRCAIYTRKSSEEGLEQEFNSLDAQRESGEAYIKSQAHEGWECLPKRYDDGRFTGGNMDRPALKRLLADIEEGKVDCVVVYKVDRLSRSLLDFARMMESFEKYDVSFVSVTQQFNTASSMGRLVLNVLLSFAQFEREIISERTRDKIAAARRKGKWAGGRPILGYDVDPHGFRLVVNEDEAVRVRAIFELYLELRAMIPVVEELERRGWRNKRWVTRKDRERGGMPFDKNSLHRLLTNVAYVGKLRYKTEVHAGEHAAIVDEGVWQRTQALLARNGRTGGAAVRNKFGALLKGILRCVPCGCAMVPSHATRNETKRYRYYVCSRAQKRGWHSCPSKSIPAGEIESFVVDQIRAVGRDPRLLDETIAPVREQGRARVAELQVERKTLTAELRTWRAQTPNTSELRERIQTAERRLREVDALMAAANPALVDEHEIEKALAEFDSVWETLSPREQTRAVQLLVTQVAYDGAGGRIAITFYPSGIQALTEDINRRRETVA